jgi:hypothetical protein
MYDEVDEHGHTTTSPVAIASECGVNPAASAAVPTPAQAVIAEADMVATKGSGGVHHRGNVVRSK